VVHFTNRVGNKNVLSKLANSSQNSMEYLAFKRL
jgi:hypothetical protein